MSSSGHIADRQQAPLARGMWIRGPLSDSVFFSFGWLTVFLAFYWFAQYAAIIILMVLPFNYLHRHYTFALVYGEPEEFERRKRLYLILPLVAVAVTGAFLYADSFPLLLAISVLWVMYHSVGQKYGITRIYSRKAGYGDAWVEKGLIFSWFFFTFFGVAEKEKGTLANYEVGRVALDYFEGSLHVWTTISYGVLVIAGIFTFLFVSQELANWHRLSVAKNLFVLSTLLLYTIFFHSIIIGYVVFAFSHALEYIALVNIFVDAKYKKKANAVSALARAAKQQWRYSALFAVGIVGLCILGRELDQYAFQIYIVGSSFLHFIYDGWIWKVRQPDVGQPFGIQYAPAR